ncbi:outer membrane transport energization protein TonB [Ekhidna lutea]|uniref:Outer membrane transport energization protein TonB n=1 Tax=Ekhidna lutea TaxID=447679 RepID=A0A239EKW6_EKHLU|nr:energy transducer TonB [Ekhidna lutea]SNS44552.1 outer membrane transport energization protein TonB [Ekhidna lutea]
MELKKNKKYELESKRPMFFGIGMIVSLSLTLVAFEWRSPIDPVVETTPVIEEPWYVLEEPKVTKQEIPELPKPKVKKQVISAAVEIKEVEKLTKAIEQDKLEIDVQRAIDDAVSSEPLKIEVIDDTPFDVVEEMPEFPGGDAALLGFIAKNIKYPKAAQRIGVEGRVTLAFVIDESGAITNIEVIRGIGAGCDEEAIRVLKLLPNYSPGKQRGVPVKVRMRLPVNFQLQ